MSIRSLENSANGSTLVESLIKMFSHLIRHGDSVSIDECQYLVVIHNRVHALNPQSVNRSVKHNPLLIRGLIFRENHHHHHHHHVTPAKLLYCVKVVALQCSPAQAALMMEDSTPSVHSFVDKSYSPYSSPRLIDLGLTGNT